MGVVVEKNCDPSYQGDADEYIAAPATVLSSISIRCYAEAEVCQHEDEEHRERRYAPNYELAAAGPRLVSKLWLDPGLDGKMQEQRHANQVGKHP